MLLTSGSQLVTDKQFCDTYQRQDYAREALDFLRDMGVMPLTLSNPLLKQVTALGMYTYLSGCLATRTRKGRVSKEFTAYITPGKRDIAEFPIEDFSKSLGITFKPNAGNYVFSENGRAYARLLHALGFHTSDPENFMTRARKARTGSSLPPYIEAVISNPDEYNYSIRRLMNPLLKDMIGVWFHTRSVIDGPRQIYATLPSQPTKQEFEYQAQLFRSAMNAAYPGANLDESQLRIRGVNDSTSICGEYLFSLEQLILLSMKRVKPLRISFEAQPSFTFQHSTAASNRV